MNLFELFDKSVPGYQDMEDDNSQLTGYDTRKTRLTLKQINKIRLMNDVRNYEKKQKLTQIQKQYGASAEGGGDEPF
jgi:hypothetical protein